MKTITVETWGHHEHAVIEKTMDNGKLSCVATLAVCNSRQVADQIAELLNR